MSTPTEIMLLARIVSIGYSPDFGRSDVNRRSSLSMIFGTSSARLLLVSSSRSYSVRRGHIVAVSAVEHLDTAGNVVLNEAKRTTELPEAVEVPDQCHVRIREPRASLS